jgi:hypothetical protein
MLSAVSFTNTGGPRDLDRGLNPSGDAPCSRFVSSTRYGTGFIPQD